MWCRIFLLLQIICGKRGRIHKYTTPLISTEISVCLNLYGIYSFLNEDTHNEIFPTASAAEKAKPKGPPAIYGWVVGLSSVWSFN